MGKINGQSNGMTSYTPLCPICGETLEGLPNPIPLKGIGRCPNGRVDFTYELDGNLTKIVVDNLGNVTKEKKYIIKGDSEKHK